MTKKRTMPACTLALACSWQCGLSWVKFTVQ